MLFTVLCVVGWDLWLARDYVFLWRVHLCVIFRGARCRGAFVDGCVVWAGVHEVSSVWFLPFGRDALTCWLVGGLLCCHWGVSGYVCV
jgi:hypothetical protein